MGYFFAFIYIYIHTRGTSVYSLTRRIFATSDCWHVTVERLPTSCRMKGGGQGGRKTYRAAKAQVDLGRVPPSKKQGEGAGDGARGGAADSWLSASVTVGTECKHAGLQIQHGCSWQRFQEPEASVNPSQPGCQRTHNRMCKPARKPPNYSPLGL